ncbi:assimilatory nitrite reductase (NAD(P)H) large subunit precursor [Branchiibius hedensis]|uniref:assimilatory sulfite reductase (ferredoxin) n=1 Tax=Branchiibius hedensis TaxID=672460 RepID=A0A2Y8ZU30_9MICO|nr:nitrite reductase large subunit NirB [Branchiibius hedensis]PWJ24974.1 assimilatory nitrite reductase (NAD(P)H) large subunit precursor [Branchiibius hedensis]SSA33789.1 assimilatory nitrite reductase (NAD(P)H) large subunit precursor [Branchiibius hedensis]
MERKKLIVVGAGMVARRAVEALVERGATDEFDIEVFGEESRPPYDRVALTSFFTHYDPDALLLGDQDLWSQPGVRLRRNLQVTQIDRVGKCVTANGVRHPYDTLVLATGSYATKPPIPGNDLTGCFVYRTVDDVAELRAFVRERGTSLRRDVRGLVVGGGLLGLEAAGALRELGAECTVVEFADRLMPLQVDAAGGAALRRLIEQLGVEVRTGTASSAITANRHGQVSGVTFADGERLGVDVVVFATGVRPRDELARESGLEVHPRGGVMADEACRTSDENIYAIGEVACIADRVWGLVGPGYTMAEVTTDRILGGHATFTGADLSTKLKLMGVDVASFGDAFGATGGSLEVAYADPVAGVYKKLVMSDDARTLLGGILVGDATAYTSLRPMVGAELGADPSTWLLPEGAAPAPSATLPDEAIVCSCNNVSAGTIRCAVSEGGCTDLGAVKGCTKAGTSCGSCVPLVKKLVDAELTAAGVQVSNALCEHFDVSRAELFEIVQLSGISTFSELLARHGRGNGCDICRPVAASILAGRPGAHVLDEATSALQDTNDHVMANLQKDGTYSVVPRIPGGEITPEGLIVIGQIAKDFDLYTKITGGQRIDLFGARIEQLPVIWQRLIDAGFESGHAYGKSLRTVKSCVGQSWCRYGVQDSVSMAILLELRYRGLRSPHKIKLGVSGCARECAEARGKDVGVIATEKGWNLYVGGNGGFTPRHAQLFAEDLDDDQLIQAIDRFLLYYVRTADRLQRTAPWIESIEGGLAHVQDVVLRDSLGIGADLDAAMATHVAAYRDEWAQALADPAKLSRFTSFVNAPQTPDPDLAYVPERGQRRPAEPVLIANPTIPVRRSEPFVGDPPSRESGQNDSTSARRNGATLARDREERS